MANTAAHLVDRVMPAVPVRQWVLSLPFELRSLAAFQANALSALARIFVESVFDVPAPQLVGTRREQLRARVILVPELVAPLTHLMIRRQNAVHRALRAEVALLIEQRRVDLGGHKVHRVRRLPSTSR